MATLAQILPRRYPGRIWRLSGDDFTTLVFLDAGASLTEAEIRAHSASVDADIAIEEQKDRQEAGLHKADRDAVLRALEILTVICSQMSNRGTFSPALGAQALNNLGNLANKLQQIRNDNA